MFKPAPGSVGMTGTPSELDDMLFASGGGSKQGSKQATASATSKSTTSKQSGGRVSLRLAGGPIQLKLKKNESNDTFVDSAKTSPRLAILNDSSKGTAENGAHSGSGNSSANDANTSGVGSKDTAHQKL